MHKLLLAAALLVALFSTGFSSVPSASASPLATLSDEALAAHNAVRQRVAHDESQRLGGTVVIPDLIWNADVAAVAQDWADQQAAQLQQGLPRPEHRPNNAYGENMYWAWSTPDLPDQSPTAAVTWWASEQQYYNYDINTCAADKVCGHYTQLVWSVTTQVGCGQSTWTQDGNNYVLWVCNYAPAGNLTINGQLQRPYDVTAAAPGTETSCVYNWTRWLRYGAQGEDVLVLQMKLNATGEELGLDGIFGDATDAAVRRFQATHGLEVDGIVGPQTQAVLNIIMAFATVQKI